MPYIIAKDRFGSLDQEIHEIQKYTKEGNGEEGIGNVANVVVLPIANVANCHFSPQCFSSSLPRSQKESETILWTLLLSHSASHFQYIQIHQLVLAIREFPIIPSLQSSAYAQNLLKILPHMPPLNLQRYLLQSETSDLQNLHFQPI